MLSRCTICGMPTDMALSDVLTAAEAKQYGHDIPLIGTCGERECIEKQLVRLNSCKEK